MHIILHIHIVFAGAQKCFSLTYGGNGVGNGQSDFMGPDSGTQTTPNEEAAWRKASKILFPNHAHVNSFYCAYVHGNGQKNAVTFTLFTSLSNTEPPMPAATPIMCTAPSGDAGQCSYTNGNGGTVIHAKDYVGIKVDKSANANQLDSASCTFCVTEGDFQPV